MNKEIKFRLFDIKDKNMYFVTLDELLFYDGNYYSTGGESKDEFIKMQYTGLKDKNGKEIYEGDIVKPILYNEFIKFGVVIYSIDRGGFDILLNNIDSMSSEKYDHFYGYDFESCEIIGNIYENPELLTNE